MKRLIAILAVSAVALSVMGDESTESADEPPPSADSLLADVVAQLPREPLRIDGTLNVRKRKGMLIKSLRFAMDLEWGEVPSRAVYTLMEEDETPLSRLTVTRSDSGEPTFAYESGADLTPTVVPDLYGSIHGTDLGWMDLTLSFLWWKNGSVVGTDDVIGRMCYVVDVPAPDATEATTEDQRYRSVRLWIDRKLHMLLQAEGRDGEGQPVRRLWVRSFKKINDRWMIKDMEVQKIPVAHRTKLTVRHVEGITDYDHTRTD